MSEYLGVTYTFKTSREQKDGRVEVDIEFNRGTAYRYVTFMFDSLEQAQANFHNRCQHKIDKFIEKRQRKRTDDEILNKITNYFSKNTTLSRSTAQNWYTENIDTEGAI